MAVSTIKASGGDYTSLSAWEAAQPATLIAPAEAECYNFALNDNFAISGITTSAANYLRIYTPISQRHDGRSRAVSGTGFRISDSTGSVTIRLGAVNHVRLEGLEIEQTGSNSALLMAVALSSGSDIRVEKCIVHDLMAGTGYTNVLTAGNLNLTWRNNVIYGNQRSWDTRGAASVLCENSTFWRHQAQLGLVSSTELTCRNTYSGHTGAASDDFWSGGTPGGNNNASSDTSALTRFPTGSINSVAGANVFVSVTPGAEDFTLKATPNALADVGATLANVPDDIKGTVRPQGAAYDIGAFELPSAGGGTAVSVTPAAGSMVLTGFAPTMTRTANQSVAPGPGAMSISGYAPSISQPHSVTAGLGQITLTGFAPTVSLSAHSNNTVVGIIVTPTIAITGYAPSVARGTSQSLGVGGSVSITGYAPSVAQTAPIISIQYTFRQLKADKYSVIHLSS